MQRNVRRPFALASWLILVVVALGSSLQPKSASAALSLVTLADSNQAWSYGQFFRTGLASSSAPVFGGVQLIPAKVQSQYVATVQLPIRLNGHASVTYRDRIFVIGGNTRDENSTLLYKSKSVFSTRLANPATGALAPWQTLPQLPQAVSDAAAVISEVGGLPYLFVLGGFRGRDVPDSEQAEDTVTTSRIFYMPIILDTQGNLDIAQSWREVANIERLRFPNTDNFENFSSPGFGGAGARDLGAAAVVVNNEPYIYVFGGNNRTLTPEGYKERYSSQVYRAKVTAGATPGTLSLQWQNDFANSNFTIKGTINNAVHTAYLADAATVKSQDPGSGNTGVYLIGGKRCTLNCEGEVLVPPFEADINAYVARINGSTGDITWLASGNMSPDGRYGHAAFESEGQINVSGGRKTPDPLDPTSAFPQPTMAEGYVNPDLSLYQENNASSFNLTQGAMADGRMFHTMETLDGGFYGDWAYIIGGTVGADTNQVQATRDVLFGNIDEPPLENDKFVSSGNYYSKVYDFGASARFFFFQWTAVNETVGDTSSPIQMFYRYSLEDGTMTNYAPVPTPTVGVDSQGRQTYKSEFPAPISSRYFQFLAKLQRPTLTSSPLLKAAALYVERTGFPNVRVGYSGASMTPSQITLDSAVEPIVPLTNQPYQKSSSETIPALPANWDGEGGFFVGMYLLPPNTPKPRSDWPAFGDTPVAYAEVQKASLPVMSPGQQFFIPPSTWRSWTDGSPADARFWRSHFNKVGEYTVYVLVDASGSAEHPFGMVTEALQPGTDGETDNVSAFTVTVSQALQSTYFPAIFAKTTAAVNAAQAPVAPRGWPEPSK